MFSLLSNSALVVIVNEIHLHGSTMLAGLVSMAEQ